MTTSHPALLLRTASGLALALAFASGASAQTTGDGWRFRGTLYGYFPSLESRATLPTGADVPIEVDAGRLIDHLKAAFMGSIEAQKGSFGAFADVMYYDVGGSRTGTGVLAVSAIPLPPGVEARATLDVKATAWTIAASWRALDNTAIELDAFAGARMLDVHAKLGYEFNADFGPFAGPARQGDVQASERNWDAIAGVRGRAWLDRERRWFLPFHLDAGTGDSDLTWQAMGGVGYAFGDAELVAGWRTLDYEFKPGSPLRDLTFSGPIVGVAYRW